MGQRLVYANEAMQFGQKPLKWHILQVPSEAIEGLDQVRKGKSY